MNQQIGGRISNCFPQQDPFQGVARYLTQTIEPLVKLEQAENGWIITIRAKGVFVADSLETAVNVIKQQVGEP